MESHGVDLPAHRTHVDLGVEQARRANDLLHAVLAHAQLVVARRRAHVDELRDARLELVEAQGPVVERRRQAEPVLHERHLARTVAFVHAANLRDRDVALIDDAQHVLGEIIDQRERRLARLAPIEMARVVLDARAEPHRLKHLEIIVGALLQPLGLKQLVGRLELRHTALELLFDGLQGVRYLGLLGHVVRSGPDGDRIVLTQDLTGHLVDLGYELHLVAEELEAQGVLRIRRVHVDHVAAHAKRAARQVVIVAIVLDIDQRMDEVVALERILLVDIRGQARIVLGTSDSVDA